jgi:hypothetical protein
MCARAYNEGKTNPTGGKAVGDTNAPEETNDVNAATTGTTRDPDQAWFWTEEWQKLEREAEDDIRAGRYRDFASMEDFLADLDSISDEEENDTASDIVEAQHSEGYETMLASEAVLRKEWDTPEEDEAWGDL